MAAVSRFRADLIPARGAARFTGAACAEAVFGDRFTRYGFAISPNRHRGRRQKASIAAGLTVTGRRTGTARLPSRPLDGRRTGPVRTLR